MLVLLQGVHELLHFLIADRIVAKIDMLNEPELPYKLGQEIETLDFVFAELEAHGRLHSLLHRRLSLHWTNCRVSPLGSHLIIFGGIRRAEHARRARAKVVFLLNMVARSF